MAGLEDLGIAGPDHLREALTNCSDPLAAIDDFQTQNGILLPSLRPALPFLDLHGVPRLDFHTSVMEKLRERLLQQIRDIASGSDNDKSKQKLLNDLLTKSFPVIKVKPLRPIVLCLLQHITEIGQEYLSYVVENNDLYLEAAVEVKQQIWQNNQALFGDEISPLLSRYIELKESILFDKESVGPTYFLSLPKDRRQEDVVQEIIRMIGKNIRLYDMVLQFLRTLFIRTRNVHYCTLRAEVLMALHDSDVQDIVSLDPCHKFAWCLDACIRERFVDLKRARELHAFLDAMKLSQEQVLGDLSMILCDAQAVYTIAHSIMKCLQGIAASETLPRASEELIILLRILSMGLKGWNMIDSQVFKEAKQDVNLFVKVIPSIVGLIVDDISATIGSKSVELDPVPAYLKNICSSDVISCTVLVHYALNVARQNKLASTMRILAVLPACDHEVVYCDTTLHDLVASLASAPENFVNPEFCSVVFDKFFLPQASKENVLRHLYRLLWLVQHRISSYKLEQIIHTVKPTAKHSDPVHKTYEAIVKKIQARPPTPVQTLDKQESNLIGDVLTNALSGSAMQRN